LANPNLFPILKFYVFFFLTIILPLCYYLVMVTCKGICLRIFVREGFFFLWLKSFESEGKRERKSQFSYLLIYLYPPSNYPRSCLASFVLNLNALLRSSMTVSPNQLGQFSFPTFLFFFVRSNAYLVHRLNSLYKHLDCFFAKISTGVYNHHCQSC